MPGGQQYLYHPAYRAAQEERKYDRLVTFGERLPELRETLTTHLALGPYERDWACALAVSLVNRAWFRVGSSGTRARVGPRRHDPLEAPRERSGARVDFRFRSKQRLLVRRTVVDAELAEAVRALLDYPGGPRLFRFDRDGSPANLTGAILNQYIADHLADGYTAKDFRTWGVPWRRRSPSPSTGRRRPPPTSGARSPRSCAQSARSSATRRPSPARRTSARRSSSSGGTGARSSTSASSASAWSRRAGSRKEEAALLSLLRSWRIRRSPRAADAAQLHLHDREVLAGHVAGDVPHGNLADRAARLPVVSVAVEHAVGAVRADRPGERPEPRNAQMPAGSPAIVSLIGA